MFQTNFIVHKLTPHYMHFLKIPNNFTFYSYKVQSNEVFRVFFLFGRKVWIGLGLGLGLFYPPPQHIEFSSQRYFYIEQF
jgi:hypothetical protein